MRLVDARNNLHTSCIHTTIISDIIASESVYYDSRTRILTVTAVLSITADISGCIMYSTLIRIVCQRNKAEFTLYIQKYIIQSDLERILEYACECRSYYAIVFLLKNHNEYTYLRNVDYDCILGVFSDIIWTDNWSCITLMLKHGASAKALLKSTKNKLRIYRLLNYLIDNDKLMCIELLLNNGLDYDTFVTLVPQKKYSAFRSMIEKYEYLKNGNKKFIKSSKGIGGTRGIRGSKGNSARKHYADRQY